MRAILWLLPLWGGILWGDPTFRKTTLPPELSVAMRPHRIGIGQGLEHWRSRISFAASALQFKTDLSGKWRLNLESEGVRRLQEAGHPSLPYLVKRIEGIPREQAVAVELKAMEVYASDEAVELARVEEPLKWGPHSATKGALPKGAYPGRWFQTRRVGDALYLTLYPVQVTGDGKVWQARSFEVRVVQNGKRTNFYRPRFRLDRSDEEALILTSPQLRSGAEWIQQDHADRWGVRSKIVTTDWIAKRYPPVSEAIYPPGYKNGGSSAVKRYDKATGKGYHYHLARQIASYLHERMTDSPKLRYVLLLGDAEEVPPSYYFRTSQGLGVTDLCYVSREECSQPQFAIGRLPFSDLTQISRYLAKLEQWTQFSGKAKNEIALYGGKAFPRSPVYIGELGTLQLLNSPKVDWLGVSKFFRTAGNYKKSQVIGAFQGQATAPLIYWLDHGMGNQLWVERDAISSREILSAKPSADPQLPFVVSVSCTNAAFDNELLHRPVLAYEPAYGDRSVAEALLQSELGAVGYLGSHRVAYGVPTYQVWPTGDLELTGSTYALKLLDQTLEFYRQKKSGRVGDFVLDSLRFYLNESGIDPKKDLHRWTYLGLALMADPVVAFPERTTLGSTQSLAHSTTVFQKDSPFPIYVLGNEPELSFDVEFFAPTQANLYQVPDYSSSPEKNLLSKLFEVGKRAVSLPMPQETGHRLMMRLENQTGVPVERRLWVQTEVGVSALLVP